MAADRVFVDTNILIYAAVVSAPLHREALARLDHLAAQGAELWVSTQVLREYMVNLSRAQSYRHPVPMPQILEQIRRLRAFFHIAEETSAVLDQLLVLAHRHSLRGKQLHDVNIVAAMLVYNITRLLTHNVSDFKQFAEQIEIMPLTEL